jgi:hypothetical protein
MIPPQMATLATDAPPAAAEADFSLVMGGPLYQLYRRGRLWRSAEDLGRRRIVAAILVTWLPLCVIALLEGQAFSGVGLPFFRDLEVQARFLVALPLLIVAEVLVHRRLAPAVRLFVEKGIVRPRDRARFDEIVASTLRLRNSMGIELVLMALVLTVGLYLWQQLSGVRPDTWYARQTTDGWRFSLAGTWFACLSLPFFQFLLIRWYFRLLLWCRFLWRVSRLDLDLTPGHPDRAAGLGFLGVSTAAFAPLVMAQSAVVSAMVGSRILHQGAHLQDFKVELAGAVVFALLQALGPLLVFIPDLLAAKRRGLREYGLLADRYVREFDRKWVRGEAKDEPFVGSADIQSLADLGNSYSVIGEMRAVPFSRATVTQIVVVTALPLLPLGLTILPFDELIRRVLGVLL